MLFPDSVVNFWCGDFLAHRFATILPSLASSAWFWERWWSFTDFCCFSETWGNDPILVPKDSSISWFNMFNHQVTTSILMVAMKKLAFTSREEFRTTPVSAFPGRWIALPAETRWHQATYKMKRLWADWRYHSIHEWYIYLHVPWNSTKCR